ncbi:hypothetical protein GCM10028807_61750 [Spirosoma daeguense]
MKTRVIFASLILGLGLAISQADAATTTSNDDSPAATKPASALLVNGSQKQLTAYVEQRIAKFAHNTNWQNFMSVVSLYNQNPAGLLTISTADRTKFNEAVAQVTNKLASQKDAAASRWMNQVNHTSRMINFIWSVDSSMSETLEIQ